LFSSKNCAYVLINLMRWKRDSDLLRVVEIVPSEKHIYTPLKNNSLVKDSSHP